MVTHRPNVVPLALRWILAVCAVCLFVYMCAGLATGYTYLPGKRGGFLLSALPTFMLVGSASALFLASLLTIVDHYDKRPNEEAYRATRRYCLRCALYLFIAAPFVEVIQRLLSLWDIDPFPQLHGLAANYTFYSPELNALARYVDPILNNTLAIALLVIATGGIGVLIQKHASDFRRLASILIAVSMLGLSTLMLADSTKDFLSGEATAGRRYNRYVVRAVEEPAKFNAILLTHFALGGFLFTASAFLIVATASGRLKH